MSTNQLMTVSLITAGILAVAVVISVAVVEFNKNNAPAAVAAPAPTAVPVPDFLDCEKLGFKDREPILRSDAHKSLRPVQPEDQFCFSQEKGWIVVATAAPPTPTATAAPKVELPTPAPTATPISEYYFRLKLVDLGIGQGACFIVDEGTADADIERHTLGACAWESQQGIRMLQALIQVPAR